MILNKKLEKALNDQILLEAESANIYLAMASWCDVSKLDNAAKFLYEHTEEERRHMMKLIRYVNENGGHAVISGVKTPVATYKDVLEVFRTALEHEYKITKAVHALYELASSLKDYATAAFLQWYVTEQQEEEQLFTDIVDKITMVGIKDNRGLYLADKALSKFVEAK